MSNWDEHIFDREENIDFLDELGELDVEDQTESLQDAITIATDQAQPGDSEYNVGLCAATIAAIWAGAPFSSTRITDDFPFIRENIGYVPEELQDTAGEFLDMELERLAEDAPEGLETFVEALS